jgi:hypothetical protein
MPDKTKPVSPGFKSETILGKPSTCKGQHKAAPRIDQSSKIGKAFEVVAAYSIHCIRPIYRKYSYPECGFRVDWRLLNHNSGNFAPICIAPHCGLVADILSIEQKPKPEAIKMKQARSFARRGS